MSKGVWARTVSKSGIGVARTVPLPPVSGGSVMVAGTPSPAAAAVPTRSVEPLLNAKRELEPWDIDALARAYPAAVRVRHFQYMRQGDGYPEIERPALHIESRVGVVVYPLAPLSCDVRCEMCREHPHLGDHCTCRGTKKRRAVCALNSHFVQAGDRYDAAGSHWRIDALPEG